MPYFTVDPQDDTLLTARMGRRQVAFDERLDAALLDTTRGEPFPEEKLFRPFQPGSSYVRPTATQQFSGGALSAPRRVYNPLRMVVNRPQDPRTFQPEPLSHIGAEWYANSWRAAHGHPLRQVYQNATIGESPSEIARRVAGGEELYPTHVNLEYSSPFTRQFLTQETGDVWKEHSQANVFKVAARGIAQMYGRASAGMAQTARQIVGSVTRDAEALHSATIREADAPAEMIGRIHHAPRSDHESHVHVRIKDAPLDREALDREAARRLNR